jgi:hypothetical protein
MAKGLINMAAEYFDHPSAIVIRDGVAVFLAPGGVPVWFDHDSVNQFIGAAAKTSL